MRQLWREVGEALLVGRREHRADRAFAQWVRENGFEDMDRRVRADAMWLAENWSEVSTAWTPDLTHPTHMRAAHREALEATRPLPFPDLDLEASEVAASGEAADIARAVPGHRKVSKLQAHVERGGFEGANAQRQLDKMAARIGMPTEKMVSISKKLDPEAGVSPDNLPIVRQNIAHVAALALQLAEYVKKVQAVGTPLTREAALAIVIETFNQSNVA
jgi:hypothetical protein